ncbi:glycosyltransferase [Pseudomaricurvus sp. HS19]|uniref:glycosyltransferase family 2 protein n=1 Tax=Pseudomaricurvus sp. HS19 TaxID=2692626 RepID=UPI00137073FA|nr:glycosyltransferase [Pseudomaricurvus sp. HS19]MYM62044.1 glycosyltransferase [Pseudomaricurvus sp. HS19]
MTVVPGMAAAETGEKPQSAAAPFFSVVIPSRNRATLLGEALDSVLNQSFSKREIIVVVDGGSAEALEQYRKLEQSQPDVRFYYLVHRENGHGPSYAMNYGVSQAQGDYVCFLDDDDLWTDPGHLARARASLEQTQAADLYFSNQEAYRANGELVTPNPWILDLNQWLPPSVYECGSHRVDAEFLLRSNGFAHFNCSIYRTAFFRGIGGLDENIRYENDRDLYLRAIDRAERILLNPAIIARHRVPDSTRVSNASTVVSDLQKRIFQLMVYEKGQLFARTELVRAHCKRAKGYQLKHIAESLSQQGRYSDAASYAWEGWSVAPTVKWFLKALQIQLSAGRRR